MPYPKPFSRPVTLAEMRERQSHFRSAESLRRGLEFRPEPADVFVATYPKCGTTWLQQIVHGLRTGGSMDFDEITAVVPWLENAHDLGIDVNGSQVATPRAFKTHLTWHEVPKGARYIYVMRDPKDVLLSYYRFFEGWFFEAGTISLETFARELFLEGGRSGRYWDHVRSWWAQSGQASVLMLCYEDIKQDLAGTVRRVAAFIGCPLDDELRDVVVRQSSFEFMHAHEHQFDDHLIRSVCDEACGLPPGGSSSKVRAGTVGAHRQALSPELRSELDAIWRVEMGETPGLESYDALRSRVAELHGRV